MIIHKKGSLFDTPEGSWLVHACNAQGVWGSGIAKEFKDRFKDSFREYYRFCFQHDPRSGAVGRSYLTAENVGCLITSYDYGNAVDSPEKILDATQRALADFFRAYVFDDRPWTIYSCRFNSGLFNVPWEKTETILDGFLQHYPNITWVVMTP
jgi:ADP-ribose 1''-phosphate phosphatase